MLNIDTSKLLDKPMDRKQFLRNVGVGVIAFTGFTAALRAISQIPGSTDMPHQAGGAVANHMTSYGGSVYGGKRPHA
jgi:hypothetical protein